MTRPRHAGARESLEQGESLLESVRRAFAARHSLLERYEALRLLDGVGDGIPGVTLDKFGRVLVAHLQSQSFTRVAALTQPEFWSEDLLRSAGLDSVCVWRHEAQASATAKAGAIVVCGEIPEEFIVNEGGLKFYVRPLSQVNAGLFLDMREVRTRLAQSRRSARVLNLFCFTGSLGIAALSGGADEVVQVDVSKGALAWARRNHELNLPAIAGRMRCIPEDAVTFVRRERNRIARGAASYHTVIVDPPSFGRSRQGGFSLERDLDALLFEVLHVLARSGTLICTANQKGLGVAELKQRVEAQALRAGRFLSQSEMLMPSAPEFSAHGEHSSAMRGWWFCVE